VALCRRPRRRCATTIETLLSFISERTQTAARTRAQTRGPHADKLEQRKLAERAAKEAAKAERDKVKATKEEVGKILWRMLRRVAPHGPPLLPRARTPLPP
jgi:hypothetical protein